MSDAESGNRQDEVDRLTAELEDATSEKEKLQV